MKKFIYLVFFLAITNFSFAQPVCPEYTSTGTSSSGYIPTSDPACAICPGGGAVGPWSGASCTGNIIMTAIAPTTSLTMAFTAVNTNDYATLSIDGGGTMTVTGENVGVAGAVIGPYTCGGSFGDVFVTVTSDLPFTTVTLTNTGCQSGWVVACPGGEAEAGDDNTATVCEGILDLSTLLSADAEPGGTWTETSGSGALIPGTSNFDSDISGTGVFTFNYEVEGCGGILDDADFTVTVGVSGQAGLDNAASLCNSPGETIDLNTLLSGEEPGGDWNETTASGQFDPVTGVFDANGLPGGTYTFTYTSYGIAPCPDDVADFTITVNEVPVVSIVSEPTSGEVCLGEEMTLTADGGGLGGVYAWDHGITNGVPFTPPVGPGTYNVTVTDANGCVGTGAYTINVATVPFVVFEADTLQGCAPLAVEFTNLTVMPGINCLWEFGDGSTNSSCGTVSHTYTTAGEFDVKLRVDVSALCSGSSTYPAYIDIRNQPIANFSHLPNPANIENTLVKFTNLSENATDYEWTFGDDSAPSNFVNPTHEYPEIPNMTYPVELFAMNDIGCKDSIIRQVFVEDVIIFYIPNIFTPDGDSFNEEFKPVMTSGYEVYDYHLTIFNRWGEMVFESFNAAYGWDGTYGAKGLVSDGVYIWKIEFGETNSDKRRYYDGHVTVAQ
jgi:gliding motility-associated-like protein